MESRPQVFVPLAQRDVLFPSNFAVGMHLVARVDSPSAALRERVGQLAVSIGPRVFLGEPVTITELLSDRLATARRRAAVLGLLGAIGLGLALIGLFGMTAFTVARRTGEIGVRMTVGARPGQVIWEVFRGAATAVSVGLLAGLAGALATSRLLEGYLFETQAVDAATLGGVAVLIAVTATIAAVVPAARAGRVTSVALLRHD